MLAWGRKFENGFGSHSSKSIKTHAHIDMRRPLGRRRPQANENVYLSYTYDFHREADRQHQLDRQHASWYIVLLAYPNNKHHENRAYPFNRTNSSSCSSEQADTDETVILQIASSGGPLTGEVSFDVASFNVFSCCWQAKESNKFGGKISGKANHHSRTAAKPTLLQV
jgi:hypothetical protein